PRSPIFPPTLCSSCFFFTATATTEIYTLSLHDALPISSAADVDRVQVADIDRLARRDARLLDGQPKDPRVGLLHADLGGVEDERDRKSTRLNSSHDQISYAVFCLKKKKNKNKQQKSKTT